jgi:metal-responsive CopG/Arc/MetJ family transcriptional regulator
MKTIAITMDVATLERLDRLGRRGGQTRASRSKLIRDAVHAYLSQLDRMAEEERESQVVRRHRTRLARQAAAAVRAQAKP